jgi:hypothetical protein
MELKKAPVPVPSAVRLSLVVGFAAVLQQTPLAVMAAPPSLVTSPPPEAAVKIILETAAVVTVGGITVIGVVNESCHE